MVECMELRVVEGWVIVRMGLESGEVRLAARRSCRFVRPVKGVRDSVRVGRLRMLILILIGQGTRCDQKQKDVVSGDQYC